ncbi:MAG: AMP-binding protein [Cyclobacteriaceae bacterium]
MLQQNLIEDIANSINSHWHLPAFSNYGAKPYTYGQLAHRIKFWHFIFKKLEIKPETKIALVGRNSGEWAEIYLSVISYGGVVIPLLPDFTAENIHHIINHSESSLLFAADSIYENLDTNKVKGLRAVFSLSDFSLLYDNDKSKERYNQGKDEFQNSVADIITEGEFQLPSIDNEQLVEIMYTSGTTGFSKGVMLNLKSLSANIVFAQENMPLKAGDRVLSFLPLAHAYACAFEFLFPVSIGAHVSFLTKLPTPQLLLKAFEEVKPRLIFLVPLLLEKIYKNKIKPQLETSKVKLLTQLPGLNQLVYKKIKSNLMQAFGGNFIEVVIGGAALNHEVEDLLKKIEFPYTVGYGMTEGGPLISYDGWQTCKKYSVGKVINFLNIRIESDDPENKAGEIMVKGENVMQGYYKNEDATNTTLEKGGWLHTGDLGVIDKDGYIFIRGRSKNMILGPSGQNIYPEEIEAQLNNMNCISESLVMESNGKLVALAYPDFEKADALNLNEKGLQEKMNENLKLINKELPAYSKLYQLKLFPEEFEKTPTKKIKRYLYSSHF